MSENATNARSAVGLPEDLNYALPRSLPSAKNQEVVISPVNGTTFNSAGQVIQLDLPCNRHSYLDTTTSMLRYKMTYVITGTGTNANHGSLLGSSASPLITQSVYANNATLLEQIQEHGVLYHTLLTSTMTGDEKNGVSSMLHSMDSFNTGHKIGADVKGGGVDGLVFDYAFPLMGVLGGNTSRFFPLWALNTLRLEYTLDTHANFTINEGTGVTVDSFTISDVEFVGNIITLSDEAQSMVMSQNPSNIYLKSRSFKHSTATLPADAGAGNYQLQVGWRASSLVGILMTCYNASMTEGKFGSICPNLTQPSHFIINGQNYPQRGMDPVNKPAMAFASLQKFWGSLSSTQHCGNITTESYLRCSKGTGVTTQCGLMHVDYTTADNQFYLGLDCEIVSKRSESLLSGIDTNSTPIFFNAQIKDPLSSNVHTINFFGYYDVIIEFDPETKTAMAKF